MSERCERTEWPGLRTAQLYHFLGDCYREFKVYLEAGKKKEFWSQHDHLLGRPSFRADSFWQYPYAMKLSATHVNASRAVEMMMKSDMSEEVIKLKNDIPKMIESCREYEDLRSLAYYKFDEVAPVLLCLGDHEGVRILNEYAYKIFNPEREDDQCYLRFMKNCMLTVSYMEDNFVKALSIFEDLYPEYAKNEGQAKLKTLICLGKNDYNSACRSWAEHVYFGEAERKSFSTSKESTRHVEFLGHLATLYEMNGDVESSLAILRKTDKPVVHGNQESKEATSVQKCPSCGARAESNDTFCWRCGSRLAGTCKQCGAELRESDKFCSKCGAKII